MPKAVTSSRNPAVQAPRAARRPTGAGRTTGRATRPLPTDLSGVGPPVPQRTQPRQGLASLGLEEANPNDQDEEFEAVHAPCKAVISQAEGINQQLTTRLNQQRREAQRFSAENTQLTAQVRQLTSEKQKAWDEVRRWKQKFDDATYEARYHVPRAEMHKALEDLHQSALSLAGQIATRKGESENIPAFSVLPGSDVAQDLWPAQQGAFDMLHGPALPGHPDSIFPAANAKDLPDFGDYLNEVPTM